MEAIIPERQEQQRSRRGGVIVAVTSSPPEMDCSLDGAVAPRHPYEELTPDMLIQTLAQRDAQIAALTSASSCANRSSQYYKRKSHDLALQLNDARKEYKAIESLLNFRPNGHNVSKYGGYSMAL